VCVLWTKVTMMGLLHLFALLFHYIFLHLRLKNIIATFYICLLEYGRIKNVLYANGKKLQCVVFNQRHLFTLTSTNIYFGWWETNCKLILLIKGRFRKPKSPVQKVARILMKLFLFCSNCVFWWSWVVFCRILSAILGLKMAKMEIKFWLNF